MANGPRGTRNQAQMPAPLSAAPPPGPLQTGSMAGAPANPYFPYPNIPPLPLWYGQLPMYNPPFPLPHSLHPQQYMAVSMTPVPPMRPEPVNYPDISEWLVHCDNHPQRSGENFSNLMPAFDHEGFRRLQQLTGDRISIEKLSAWLSIGKGTADLIIRYVEEDIAAIHAGTFQISHGAGGSHGQDAMQP